MKENKNNEVVKYLLENMILKMQMILLMHKKICLNIFQIF